MIYLDNAATTYPKPPGVHRAMSEALIHFGANPGRGGYRMAMTTAERVYACREALASLFSLEDPSILIGDLLFVRFLLCWLEIFRIDSYCLEYKFQFLFCLLDALC